MAAVVRWLVGLRAKRVLAELRASKWRRLSPLISMAMRPRLRWGWRAAELAPCRHRAADTDQGRSI